MKRVLSKKKKRAQLISFIWGAVCVLLGTVTTLLGALSVQARLVEGFPKTNVIAFGFSIILLGIIIVLFGTITILFGKRVISARILVRNPRTIRFAKKKMATSEIKNVRLNKNAA